METAENELEHAKRFFSFLESGQGVEITAMYPAGKIGTNLLYSWKSDKLMILLLIS